MLFKSKGNTARSPRAQRKALRKAAALSPDQQSLATVYALGIRDGLQIAADIRRKTQQAGESAS